MIKRLYTSCLAIIAATSPALSQVDFGENILSHRIIPGWIDDAGSHVAALEITLAPGWKTYWRVPGDAGIPPRFDWNTRGNLRDVDIQWPSPDVFWQYGMRSVGYTERVVLPLTVRPKKAGKDVRLKGRMDLGVCADVCVPASFEFDAVLPASAASKPAPLVAALAALPFSASEAGVTAATCAFQPVETGLEIKAQVHMPSSGGAEEAVIEPPVAGIWVSDAKTARSGNVLTIRATMVSVEDAPPIVNRSDIRITVIGGNYSVDIQGCTG